MTVIWDVILARKPIVIKERAGALLRFDTPIVFVSI